MGYTHAGIVDYASLSGCVEHYNACKDEGIEPVFGAKFHVVDGPEDSIIYSGEIIVLAKNQAGWHDLLKIIAKTQSEKYNHLRKTPELQFSELFDFDLDNLYVLDGFTGSVIRNEVMSVQNKPEYREDVLRAELEKYKDVPNFILVTDIGEEQDREFYRIAKRVGTIPKLITNAYYVNESDSIDHHVMLSIKLNLPIDVAKKHVDYKRWFESSKYFVHEKGNLDLEFEPVEILAQPRLPKFECPDDMSLDDYLKHLCKQGWSRIKNRLHDTPEVYGKRVNEELEVFKEFNLAGYMLIVWDLIRFLREKGWLVGVRGSCFGSLVAYLLNITDGDPIEYGLFFQRFMNKGRMSKDRVSLPDIDIDVPPEAREQAIEYLKNKYGDANVMQLPTFGSLKAKAVIHGVLRAHNACPPQVIDEITKHIPDESKVSDELADKKQSLLEWAIENIEELHNYVRKVDNKLFGEFAEYFEQALRLEGVYQTLGKHAGGVIVCREKLVDCSPTLMQSDGSEPIIGVEMNAAEAMGLIKLDVLGLDALSKLMLINDMLMGKFEDTYVEE